MCVSAPLFSRTSNSSSEGKCDARLDTPLPQSVRDDFLAVAVVLGYGSAAELNRCLIEQFLYGTLTSVRVASRSACVDGRKVG